MKQPPERSGWAADDAENSVVGNETQKISVRLSLKMGFVDL